jgi:hypothetical protein
MDSIESAFDRNARLAFVDPVGSMSQVVHFGASREQNGDALFFMLGWDQCGFNKKHTETCYTELVILLPV